MTRAARTSLCGTVLALVCVLVGCAEEGRPGGPAGPSDGAGRGAAGRTPCPPSSAPPSPGVVPPGSATGKSTDSQSHSLDPNGDCVIDSGIPAMPVDP